MMAAADEEVEDNFSPLRYRAEATAIIDEVFSPIDPSPHTKARGAAARRAERLAEIVHPQRRRRRCSPRALTFVLVPQFLF